MISNLSNQSSTSFFITSQPQSSTTGSTSGNSDFVTLCAFEGTEAGYEEFKAAAGNTLTALDRNLADELKDIFGIEYQETDKGVVTLASISSITGELTIEGMEKKAAAGEAVLEKQLRSFMLNEGISSNPPIELRMGSDGLVTTVSDHPDKEKIENFFKENRSMRDLFSQTQNANEFVAVAKEAIAFQTRYAEDPEAALKEFSYLFSGHYSYQTTLTLNSEEMTMDTIGKLFA